MARVPGIGTAPGGRREQLLQAGERLFAEHGYRGVTIAEVAAAVGVSTGSFYNHFPDKETFFGAILDRLTDQGVLQARRVTARFKNPMNQLKALFRFITLGLRSNPLLLAVLTDERRFGYPSPDERDRRRQRLLQSVGGLIDDILADGIRRLIFRVGRYHDARRLLLSIYGALIAAIDSDDFEQLTQDMLLLMDRGLRRRLTLTGRANRRDRRQARTREGRTQEGGTQEGRDQ
ncbi:MAG: TetR/AcrR family transcriptional regulator [Spirochaetaceae bacterium]|nr:TetR/AcrR family transcriptional regulator [Spirochaetaceae bacterium]